MTSFELIYEEEEDVLEATFAVIDEHFSRTLTLNDNIVVHTDMAVSAAWGITLYSYRQLLQVSETHLDGLRELDPENLAKVWAVLHQAPARYFIEVRDPVSFRALIKAPDIEQLLQG